MPLAENTRSGLPGCPAYLKNTDLIRVTGYLVKKSEVEKYRKGEVALRDTTWYGSGTDECAQVFDRQLRDEQDVSAS